MIGSGARIPLDFSALIKQNVPFSLFPGQIVMLEGVNPDGKCLHVQKFLHPSNPLMRIPKLPEAYADYNKFSDNVLAVMVAAGPFALDSATPTTELNFSPLDALFASVASKQPEVLILCGPFVDSENSSVKAGSLQQFPDQIFHLEVSLRISELRQKCPDIRILLVPSMRDLGSAVEYLYPQPPLLLNPKSDVN
jgi:DNA polymerase alpha subunit B